MNIARFFRFLSSSGFIWFLFMITACSCIIKPDNYKWEFYSLSNELIKEGVVDSSSVENEFCLTELFAPTNELSGKLIVYRGSRKAMEKDINKGVLHGQLRFWYPNGMIMQEQEFYEGKQNGKMFLWYENGQLQSSSFFENDLIHGVTTNWYRGGGLQSIIGMSNGVSHGVRKRWDESGHVVEDGVFYKMQPWSGQLIILKKREQSPMLGIYSNGVLVNKYYWQAP